MLDLLSYVMYDSVMTAPTSFTDLIDLWPTIKEFADDIGCGYEAARQMRRRNAVAAKHWPRIIEACASREIEGVDYTWLAALATSEQHQEACHAA